MSSLVIGYAGLTHLGLNSLVAAAARGFTVIGYHDDESMVADLIQGKPPIDEPQLPELLDAHSADITFGSSAECLSNCDIVYISVDIPTDDFGASDLKPIREVITQATSAMHTTAVLVVLCQVPPGFTRLVAWPPQQLYYQVETLIFGRAVQRALHPERFILGCARPLEPVHAQLLSHLQAYDCPILSVRYESAELAKISINMFLVASVTTTNMLAELCEKVGADWAEIVPSLRLDQRIGTYAYLKPGLGIAGGNLERDLATVMSYAQSHNTDASIVAAWTAHSLYCKNWAWRKLNELVLSQMPNAQIAVLGLTYKEDTNSTKNSASLALLCHLSGTNLSVFDPSASLTSTSSGIRRTQTALDAIINADVLLIMTPWSQFRSITAHTLSEHMRGRIVIDPYRMLDRGELLAMGFSYITLGAPVDLEIGC